MRKKFIYEPAKRIQVADNVDVAVAGGGPTGIGATIGAVRVGARVALIERNGFMGGMGSVLMAFFGGPPPYTSGIAKEIYDRMIASGTAQPIDGLRERR
jgi:heterodisulfide reductase subunit A-like polyferredoxin